MLFIMILILLAGFMVKSIVDEVWFFLRPGSKGARNNVVIVVFNRELRC